MEERNQATMLCQISFWTEWKILDNSYCEPVDLAKFQFQVQNGKLSLTDVLFLEKWLLKPIRGRPISKIGQNLSVFRIFLVFK